MVEQSNYFPQVQLFISCRKLKDMDVFSKSDPTVEVYRKSTREGEWNKLGRTEVIWDNLNPDFTTYFLLEFHFEEQTFLKFKVYDVNDKSESIQNSDYIGEAETTLGEIIGSPGQQLIKTLRIPGNKESRGNIVLRTEQTTISREKIQLKVSAKDLEDISGFFSKFKPFFYVSRVMENGTYQRVYASEHCSGKSPSWKRFEKLAGELCNNDYNRPLLIEVYDYHSSGNHQFVASAQFTLQEITEGGQRSFPLKNKTKAKKKKYKNSGTIIISEINTVQIHNFLDYIAGGCEIALVVGLDFTASNRDPRNPSSLHFLNPNDYNDYEKALFSVGEILLNYDSDKLVPMYGFGGKIQGQVNHCFPLTFNYANTEVQGLGGMMQAYRNALTLVELSGPTLFSHVIRETVQQAEAAKVSQTNQKYFVLMIITDGEIHDMRETIDWIVRGSESPLSIVIVGVGKENFGNMVVLDADDVPLVNSKGKTMKRDIVQFVPFRNVGNSATELAREVLDEIPREIVNFFEKKGIKPNPPILAQDPSLMRSDTQESNQTRPFVPQSQFTSSYPHQTSFGPSTERNLPNAPVMEPMPPQRNPSSLPPGAFQTNNSSLPPGGFQPYPPSNATPSSLQMGQYVINQTLMNQRSPNQY